MRLNWSWRHYYYRAKRMTKREELIDRLAYRYWREWLGIFISSYPTYESWCIDCPESIRKSWSLKYLNYKEEELMATLLSGAK